MDKPIRVWIGGGADGSVCSWDVYMLIHSDHIEIIHEGGCLGSVRNVVKIYKDYIEVDGQRVPTPWASEQSLGKPQG